MNTLLDLCAGLPEKSFDAGQTLMAEGTRTGLLFVLIEGGVDIVKEDHVIGSVNVPGSVFGEISFLLDAPHTATVKANVPSRFFVTTSPQEIFKTNPLAYYHIAVNLATRIRSLNDYFVTFKNETNKEEFNPELLALVDVVLYRTA